MGHLHRRLSTVSFYSQKTFISDSIYERPFIGVSSLKKLLEDTFFRNPSAEKNPSKEKEHRSSWVKRAFKGISRLKDLVIHRKPSIAVKSM